MVVVLIALAAGAFLLDRLGMKGYRWRIWAPAIAHGGDPMPAEACGGFRGPGMQTVGHDGTTYAYTPGGHAASLLLRDGRATATGYVVHDVVAYDLAVRYPFGKSFYAEAAPCGGDAVFADGAWTFRLTSPECAAANGTWHRERLAVVEREDRTCSQYTACACALAGIVPDVYGVACEQANAMLGAAPDDPDSCRGGLAMARRISAQRGVALPSSCEER